jgi:hypothetical protein
MTKLQAEDDQCRISVDPLSFELRESTRECTSSFDILPHHLVLILFVYYSSSYARYAIPAT